MMTTTKGMMRTRRRRAHRSHCCASARRRTQRHPTCGYNCALGEGISRDPIAERGGENLYAFAQNRPTLGIDRLGLSFKLVSGDAIPGTIDPNQPDLHGKTGPSKYELLIFTVKPEEITCATCAEVSVTRDYELEVTSIIPSTIPYGYTENGYDFIVGHEDRRALSYRMGYSVYLEPVKGILEGARLCCSLGVSRAKLSRLLYDWARSVTEAHEAALKQYVESESREITRESDVQNIIKVNGLIDGSRYVHTLGQPAPVQTPSLPTGCP